MRFLSPIAMVAAWLLIAPSPPGKRSPLPVPRKTCRVMFYNTENLFDTRDDSLTNDEEFTPSGSLHWTYSRYHTKQNNLYKTIIALGGWQPPDLIGICEIENRFVLSDLVNNTPLSKFEYRFIHADSPDLRGIDVALLYNPATVRIIQSQYLTVHRQGLHTRDILMVKFLAFRDTCLLFINHWPSRSSGQLKTEISRMAAASCLRFRVDSLFRINPAAKIMIVGDFNDEPRDESLFKTLMANPESDLFRQGNLYNLSYAPTGGKFTGTVKYKGQWSIFDQIIVSGGLLTADKGLCVMPDGYRIFGASFLLTPDEQYNGYKPYRTYNGFHYQGGFSDHLPVYIDLCLK